MLNINQGIKKDMPIRCVIYGTEGIGKTTLASHMPDPLMLDLERGSNQLDVRRVTDIKDWPQLLAAVKEIAATSGVCKTLVIDSLDRAEAMCTDHTCKQYGKKSVEDFSYGKGYVLVADNFAALLDALDSVIGSGVHVVLIAHAAVKKHEQPDEMGAYDRWVLRLSRQVAPIVKEWADLLLFCNYLTHVVSTDNGKHKVQGGKRVMYTSHNACWDAKNRYGLPETLDLNYKNIAHIFADTDSTTPDNPARPLLAELQAMMTADNIADADVQRVMAAKGYYAADTAIADYADPHLQMLVNNWIAIKQWVEKNNKA